MKHEHHHISVGLEKVTDNTLLLKLCVSGKLSHDDYDVFVPMLESALETTPVPRLRFFLDATDMEGWEPRAAWDDVKFGFKHGNKFDKIAIFGNKKWLELSAKIGSWFMSGEVKFFENRGKALEWINH